MRGTIKLMDIGTERKILFDLDISYLKSLVQQLTDKEWKYDLDEQLTEFRKMRNYNKEYPLARRKMAPSPHRDTDTIALIWEKYDRKPNISEELEKEILKVSNKIREYYGADAKILRLMLAKLPSKKEIPSHTDTGILETIHRCHLPIITDEKVIFFINDKPLYFKEGEVSEINNVFPHAVVNDSDIDRVHLICDVYE